MSDTKEAVGLRLTSKLWDSLKQYGLERHPSDKSKKGFDVTQTIETLLCQALGISLETPTPLFNAVSNTTSDDRLTDMIKEQLNKLLLPALYDSISDSQSCVSELLNSKITDIVNTKFTDPENGLEAYTTNQCKAVRDELVSVKKELISAKKP